MIGTKQLIAMGALSAAVAATWGPFLMKEQPPPRHAEEEGGNGPLPTAARDVDEDLDEEDFEAGAPPEPERAPPAAAASILDDSGGLKAKLERFTELRTLLPREGEPGLNALAGGWMPASPGSDGDAFSPPGAVAEAGPTEAEEFLARNPLSAILFSKDAPCALLGPHVVRRGQEIVPGLAIHDIEPRAIQLINAGSPLRLELPPVRSRRPAHGAETGEEEEPEADADTLATSPEKVEGKDQ